MAKVPTKPVRGRRASPYGLADDPTAALRAGVLAFLGPTPQARPSRSSNHAPTPPRSSVLAPNPGPPLAQPTTTRSPEPQPYTFYGPTLDEAMDAAIQHHLDLPHPDVVLNIESHIFNVLVAADTCEYHLDVGRTVWLNRPRWSRLIKEYVPLDNLNRFVEQAAGILDQRERPGATANMLFRDPERFTKRHRWGGCLMGMVFRGDNAKAGPATLTLYSRTTYIGYMGLLDAGIASRVAWSIAAKHLNAPPRTWNTVPIRFRWYIASQQFHCFKSLPYVYSRPHLMARLEHLATDEAARKAAPPTWMHLAAWYKKILASYAEHGVAMLHFEKYGPFRRVKRRWLEYKRYLTKNLPPSLPIDRLGFEKAI